MTDPTDTSTVAADADQIATTADAAGAVDHAPQDDDQRWIETVVASLDKRSRETRQALAAALLDGQTDGVPLLAPATRNTRKNQGNRRQDGPLSVFATRNCYGKPTSRHPQIRREPSLQSAVAATGPCYGICRKVCFDEGAGSTTGIPSLWTLEGC